MNPREHLIGADLNLNLLELTADQIRDYLRRGILTVAVFGLGNVGLALVAVWLRAGAKVVGVDIDKEKVESLNAGLVPHFEKIVVETVRDASQSGRFRATVISEEAVGESHVLVVAVPVSYGSWGPDFSALDSVVNVIGRNLRRGQAVILESSVPPLTTEYRVKPALEKLSGLAADVDFALIYSPERVLIGRAVEDIEERYPKIVAGVGPRSLALAEALYANIAKAGVIKASSPRVAEFAKLAEGVYRDVNIALVNELSKLSRAIGIDFTEVVQLANTQPYSHLHRPGAGVGGHCIPVYPRFLSWLSRLRGVSLELVETARRINEEQPLHVVGLLLLEMGWEPPREARVSVLGLSYRGNVPISAGSPTYRIVSELSRLGFKVVVQDPLIDSDQQLKSMGIELVKDLGEALRDSAAVIVATDHDYYKTITPCDLVALSRNPDLVIIDARDVIDVSKCCGARYLGIGRGRICSARE